MLYRLDLVALLLLLSLGVGCRCGVDRPMNVCLLLVSLDPSLIALLDSLESCDISSMTISTATSPLSLSLHGVATVMFNVGLSKSDKAGCCPITDLFTLIFLHRLALAFAKPPARSSIKSSFHES